MVHGRVHQGGFSSRLCSRLIKTQHRSDGQMVHLKDTLGMKRRRGIPFSSKLFRISFN